MPKDINEGMEQRRLDHQAAMVVVGTEGLAPWLADTANSMAGSGRLWILPDGRSFFPINIRYEQADPAKYASRDGVVWECVEFGWQLIPAGELGSVLGNTLQLMWHSGKAARGWSKGDTLSHEDRDRLRLALGDEAMKRLEASDAYPGGTIWDRWARGY